MFSLGPEEKRDEEMNQNNEVNFVCFDIFLLNMLFYILILSSIV